MEHTQFLMLIKVLEEILATLQRIEKQREDAKRERLS